MKQLVIGLVLIAVFGMTASIIGWTWGVGLANLLELAWMLTVFLWATAVDSKARWPHASFITRASYIITFKR